MKLEQKIVNLSQKCSLKSVCSLILTLYAFLLRLANITDRLEREDEMNPVAMMKRLARLEEQVVTHVCPGHVCL